MLHRFTTMLLATTTTLATGLVPADPGGGNGVGQPPMFGRNHPFTPSDLPPGRTRARLEALPEPARRRALEWLHRFDFPANDLDSMEIDDAGGVLYVDPVPPEPATGEEPASDADGTVPEPAASAPDDAFALHSLPGSPHIVYLDFDGHTITGTAWNTTTDPLYARPFDLDGSPTTFNDTERAAIAEIWHRVAEDYAAFDIDVTTEAPASFGPHTGRILITSKTDADGRAMPYNSAGGVAYVGVWGRSNYASYYSPALIYYDNLAKGTTYMAEAGSHEFGHNLGLSHDGTSSVAYYTGHGSGYISWAPIMGIGYYNNVTQWSKGEYVDANNTQDDIAIIASQLYLVGDDHGDTSNSATPLAVDGTGQILVSNPETDPHNFYPENKGVIDSAADQDVFSFSAVAGQVDLVVNPAWDAFYRTSKRGANLDLQARLLDAGGATLATSDPALDTYASITANVPGGAYYLVVSGVGSSNYSDYASMGQYFVSGAVPAPDDANVPPTASFGFACADLSCSFTDTSNDSDGAIVAWAWEFADGTTSAEPSPTHGYASAGTYPVGLTVTDDMGATASVTKSVTVSAPNAPPTADFGVSCTDLSCSFTDGSTDSDGSIASWTWNFGDGATSAAPSPSHTYASAGTYSARLTVTDDDGATAAISRTITVAGSEDSEAPVVIITSPDDGAEVSDSVTLSAYATDNREVVQINLYADGKLLCSGITSASCKWNLRKVPGGTHTVGSDASDAAGNTASASVTFTVVDGGAKGNSDKDSSTVKVNNGRNK
jgi:PKD repeat protein